MPPEEAGLAARGREAWEGEEQPAGSEKSRAWVGGPSLVGLDPPPSSAVANKETNLILCTLSPKLCSAALLLFVVKTPRPIFVRCF